MINIVRIEPRELWICTRQKKPTNKTNKNIIKTNSLSPPNPRPPPPKKKTQKKNKKNKKQNKTH